MSAERQREDRVPFWPGFSTFAAALTLMAGLLVATFVGVYGAVAGRGVSMRVVVPSIGGPAPELQVTVSPRTSSRLPQLPASNSSSGMAGNGEVDEDQGGVPTPEPTPTPVICTLNPVCAPGPEAGELTDRLQ